jgi:hypothetical protein
MLLSVAIVLAVAVEIDRLGKAIVKIYERFNGADEN